MATYQTALSNVFAALADPTRLAVVERLTRGPARVTDLAAPFDMARPSFLKHLKVLEEAGLVVSRKTGRVRMVSLAPQPFMTIEDWVRAHRLNWKRRLDDLGVFLSKDTAI